MGKNMKIAQGWRWCFYTGNDGYAGARREGLFYPEEQKYFTLTELREIIKEMEKLENANLR
jgi:hypothetical protein